MVSEDERDVYVSIPIEVYDNIQVLYRAYNKTDTEIPICPGMDHRAGIGDVVFARLSDVMYTVSKVIDIIESMTGGPNRLVIRDIVVYVISNTHNGCRYSLSISEKKTISSEQVLCIMRRSNIRYVLNSYRGRYVADETCDHVFRSLPFYIPNRPTRSDIFLAFKKQYVQPQRRDRFNQRLFRRWLHQNAYKLMMSNNEIQDVICKRDR